MLPETALPQGELLKRICLVLMAGGDRRRRPNIAAWLRRPFRPPELLRKGQAEISATAIEPTETVLSSATEFECLRTEHTGFYGPRRPLHEVGGESRPFGEAPENFYLQAV